MCNLSEFSSLLKDILCLRIFRKEITGGADKVEVIFMNARNQENFDIHGDDLNQRVKSLSRKVCIVQFIIENALLCE